MMEPAKMPIVCEAISSAKKSRLVSQMYTGHTGLAHTVHTNKKICHSRATELCVLVMRWSTGGLMTPGFVTFSLVGIHASKC